MAAQQPRETGDDPLSFLKTESVPTTVSQKARAGQDNTLVYGALALTLFGGFVPLLGWLFVAASVVLLVTQHCSSKSKLSTGGIVAAVVAWIINGLRLSMLLVLLLR